MGQTTYYDIPYPECDRPLRQDSSDIADFRDLAEAADDALDEVYDLAGQLVFVPDAARMATGAAVAAVGQNITPYYDIISISQGNGMATAGDGTLHLVEPGRYWVGAYASLTALGMLSPRLRFVLDYTTFTNFQTPGIVITANTAICQSHAVLTSMTENATLQTQVRHSASAALAYTYTSRLWAIQLERF